MISVVLSPKDSAHKAAIRAKLEELIDRDVNFNGADFSIQTDEFTFVVDDLDASRASFVYGVIRNVIDDQLAGAVRK